MSSDIDSSASEFLQNMIFTKNISVKDGKLMLLGRPGLILNADILVSLYKPLLERDPQILEDAGYVAISSVAEDYKKRFTNRQDMINFIKKASPLYGIGVIDILIQKDKAIVNLDPSPLAEEYLRIFGRSDRPICYFTKGIAKKFFEATLGKTLNFQEVSCVAKGDRLCSFVADL